MPTLWAADRGIRRGWGRDYTLFRAGLGEAEGLVLGGVGTSTHPTYDHFQQEGAPVAGGGDAPLQSFA